VPGLVRQLPKVLDDATRALILDLLGQAGPAARPATAAILDVRKARPDLLGHCAAALAKIDRPAARQLLPVLLAALPRVPAKNAGLFVAAFHDLGPDAAPAVPALTTLLKATAPGERTEILQALGAIGAAPTAELQGLLADPRGTALERQEAVAALARVGPAAVALLEAILAGPDPLLALIAAAGLDRLRPGVPLPAARWQALVEAALRHDRQTRTPLPLLPNMGGVSNWGRLQTPLFQAVAAALGLHPPAAPHLAATTLPTLARPWDEDWILWDDAATVARRLGPAARTAAPFLVRGLAHEGDRPVQPAAFLEWDHVKALVAIGPEAIPALIEGLGDPVLVERGLPVVLGLFGAVAVPPLLDLIMDEELCPYAVTALGRLGAAARPAVPALGALTRHEEFAVRRAAVTALLRIDPAAVPPLP
jgi:HEAT repeat protein